jgi:hypothetical protein
VTSYCTTAWLGGRGVYAGLPCSWAWCVCAPSTLHAASAHAPIVAGTSNEACGSSSSSSCCCCRSSWMTASQPPLVATGSCPVCGGLCTTGCMRLQVCLLWLPLTSGEGLRQSSVYKPVVQNNLHRWGRVVPGGGGRVHIRQALCSAHCRHDMTGVPPVLVPGSNTGASSGRLLAAKQSVGPNLSSAHSSQRVHRCCLFIHSNTT